MDDEITTKPTPGIQKLVEAVENLAMGDTTAANALREVLFERKYQLRRWSTEHDKGHIPSEWIAILSVYIGKAAMETPLYGRTAAGFRKRVVQIAAICLAILESMESNNGDSRE